MAFEVRPKSLPGVLIILAALVLLGDSIWTLWLYLRD